jgi:hypothetical protein
VTFARCSAFEAIVGPPIARSRPLYTAPGTRPSARRRGSRSPCAVLQVQARLLLLLAAKFEAHNFVLDSTWVTASESSHYTI